MPDILIQLKNGECPVCGKHKVIELADEYIRGLRFKVFRCTNCQLPAYHIPIYGKRDERREDG